MNRIVFLVLPFFLIGCANEDNLILVSYSTEGCNMKESIKELNKLRNRIIDYHQVKDTTLIEVFFVENCGFIIAPKITLNGSSLLIEADQYFEDSTRMGLLCTCCFTFQMKVLGIEENEIGELNYFLKLSDTHPERIYITDSIYYTYQIDFLIFESDTLYYPQEDNIYTKRIYERDNSEGYIYSYFSDSGHLYLNRINYQSGERLRIHNDFYRRTDTLDQIIEEGKVDYLFLEEGKGVEVVL